MPASEDGKGSASSAVEAAEGLRRRAMPSGKYMERAWRWPDDAKWSTS
jgi:hypothetical protein